MLFLVLSQDVVSFQYSWEAGGKGRKILCHVQCLEQVSRTGNMFIVSSFNVLHRHGNVMDSCCGSVFPPGKQRLLLFVLCFCSTMDYMKLPGNSKIWSLFMGHMGRNVNVFLYVHSYLKYLFDKFVNVSRSNQCLELHLNKPSSLYTFRTEKNVFSFVTK